jgi:predicted phage terminase large subunit-like protein
MCTSYSDELASDFGRKVRNIVADSRYQAIFPGVTLSEDARAAGRWTTSNGGSYVSAGIGGSLTGKGADCLIIDDSLRNREDADSERIRDRIWNIYESDLQSRLMPGGAIVAMGTRYHDDDLPGRLLERQKHGGDTWHVIKLPAIAHEGTPQERALWPEWYPLDVLKRRRDNVSPRVWASLYQQEPTADDGTYFRREWFKRFRLGEQPKRLNIYTTSDFAVTSDGGDYTEHGVWGIDPDGNIWALDWWSGQVSADVWIDSMLDKMELHRPLAAFGESGVIRRAIEPMLVRRMRERRVYARVEWVASVSDKATRARSFQARASMGRVYIPLVSWGDRLINQLLRFPAGANDDAVDCCSMMGLAIDQAHPAVIAPQTEKPKLTADYGRNPTGGDDWKTA